MREEITQDSINKNPAREIARHMSAKVDYQLKGQLWAIGGGKGGVGKSFISANMAIGLANAGHSVVAIDFDLGGANLHTCLGVPIPDKTLTDFLSKKYIHIDEILVDTPFPNLKLISGAQDEYGVANLKNMGKRNLLRGLKQLNVDYILLDLGAGTTLNTIDFFLFAHQGILVTLPEPTSIENTYRFIKSVIFRKLQSFEGIFEIDTLIDKSQGAKLNDKMSSPVELINSIKEINPQIGDYIQKEIQKLNFNLIVNQTRNEKERSLGYSMQTICKKYFGFNLNYLDDLEHDASVWQSIKMREPLMKLYPNSLSAMKIKKVIKELTLN